MHDKHDWEAGLVLEQMLDGETVKIDGVEYRMMSQGESWELYITTCGIKYGQNISLSDFVKLCRGKIEYE